MITEEFSFPSQDKKTTIHAVKWMNDMRQYHAILQISHGMIEYIERYQAFAEYLTEHGFLVVGHDHLGHGESVTSQENWGYFADEHPSDILVEDMHTLRRMIQKENAGVPYFMLAHSMGSYLLRKYLTRYPKELSGAILCGTGYSPWITTTSGLMLVRIFCTLKGWKFRNQKITNLIYNKSYQKFDLTGRDLKNSWLTRDEKEVEAYGKEPKCQYLFTINGYQGLIEAVKFDCKQKHVDEIPNDLPILFASGDEDPVGDLGKGVQKVYRMFQKSGKKDVTCKLYPGMRHEILNEIGREEVYQDIRAWMEHHI